MPNAFNFEPQIYGMLKSAKICVCIFLRTPKRQKIKNQSKDFHHRLENLNGAKGNAVMVTSKTLVEFRNMSSIICLGPSGAGKTLLLKKLQNENAVDETSCTIPTTGSNLTTLRFHNEEMGTIREYEIRELGGAMAPIWHKYYGGVNKVIYVVDASNLCQISAAGILLFSILADPQLINAKVLIVLTKMDVSYRQMRNEALLMLQMKRLQREVPQEVTILESSAVSGMGVQNIAKWIQGELPNNSKVLLK